MEVFAVTVPSMWADHHVLAVRKALTGIKGVEQVDASALERSVRVSFDAAATDAKSIAAKLAEAGYDTGDAAASEISPSNKPEWLEGGLRSTTTYPADLSMSGDYRKY